MGQTNDQIEADIDTRRNVLAANIRELESRVRRARTVIFAAFGGVLLLAALLKARQRVRPVPTN